VSRALLDVSVLLAVFDPDHVDHSAARGWLAAHLEFGWASCALTENGFVRVLSQPRYPHPVPPGRAVQLLERARASDHEFWDCELSLTDPAAVDRDRLHGPQQVTDVYLLALAVRHGGRLVTFDRTVPLSAAPGATSQHLVVL